MKLVECINRDEKDHGPKWAIIEFDEREQEIFAPFKYAIAQNFPGNWWRENHEDADVIFLKNLKHYNYERFFVTLNEARYYGTAVKIHLDYQDMLNFIDTTIMPWVADIRRTHKKMDPLIDLFIGEDGRVNDDD